MAKTPLVMALGYQKESQIKFSTSKVKVKMNEEFNISESLLFFIFYLFGQKLILYQ